MQWLVRLLLLFFIAAAGPSSGQRMMRKGDLCEALADVAGADCYGCRYKKVDAQMQSYMRTILAALPDDEARNDLNLAQAAWKRYRELSCIADRNSYWRPDSPAGAREYEACVEFETRLRLKNLHTIYSGRVEWVRHQ